VTTLTPQDDDVAGDALLIDVDHTPALRRALEEGVPFVSTPEAARWVLEAIGRARGVPMRVRALQDVHAATAAV
jgi:carbamoyl-phosphate synthase large subunit